MVYDDSHKKSKRKQNLLLCSPIRESEWQAKDCNNNEPKGSIDDPDPHDAAGTFIAPQISGNTATCSVDLKVTDNGGDSDTDTVEITVNGKAAVKGPFAIGPNAGTFNPSQ